MKLKIEYLNKEDLKPYANNAKIHTGEQVEQIKKSIEEFGFNDPIAIWHDNEVIEGHGRLIAVMEMEDIEQVPVIRLDDLTDEQLKLRVFLHAESYCIGKSLRMIKKNAPHIKWVVSFADGTQCGDGTIYRASNFVLTSIKQNTSLRRNPKTGEVMQDMTAYHRGILKEYKQWEKVSGYQLRYVYFIDKKCKDKLTVPIIPFSKIDEIGAGMYKGERIAQAERHAILSERQKEVVIDG